MEKKMGLTDFVYAALFAALTTVLGFISIPLPISPVPISGLSLGIMLAGTILTVRQAVFSVLTLVLMGAAGVPVFSGLTGGIGVLLGPRGGYYFGFLLGVGLIAWLKGRDNQLWRLALANLTGGVVLVYLFGVSWLSFITGMGLEKALIAGALPFIPGDLFKVAVATVIGAMVNRQRQKFGGSR
ncbi:biotin transporter BioY|uniref:Biotin transporter n=1 Tax=Dendrosporobacter quercicolus TaxID=146817 RepID=A0A1G9QXI0_9FIRM|nr:biotin transporter BioY [Dendrosporobacter quercicolus]NSL48401.1 biotin transporter BioY [Dendrosporobacter quercicolus DSM 1736]SDM15580.1 biotin transport system substrate-specific component [Dendrosporobacter quercicolus]